MSENATGFNDETTDAAQVTALRHQK